MDISPSRIKYLFERYASSTITDAERQALMEILAMPDQEQLFKELIDERLGLLEQEGIPAGPLVDPDHASAMLSTILRAPEPAKIISIETAPRKNRRYWTWAAAILLFLAAGTAYWYTKHQSGYPVARVKNRDFKNDVLPGTSKAMLTLAGGQTIILDSANKGAIARQGGVTVIKLDSGRLTYQAPAQQSSTIVYNTLTTPRGGQYQLDLPDGSRVWLNAASSIKYPVVFTERERNVTITGEAYFEVAHDPAKPFHVRVNDIDVEVLGTHFNINAYEDEARINTTLLEGSVKLTVVSRQQAAVLKPGQQAQYNNTGAIQVIDHADLDQTMAWKNGLFHFNSTGIETLMRQVARWYDVDVVYEGPHTQDSFSGGIPRTATLTELLAILQVSRVHFKLDGKKLTVLP